MAPNENRWAQWITGPDRLYSEDVLDSMRTKVDRTEVPGDFKFPRAPLARKELCARATR